MVRALNLVSPGQAGVAGDRVGLMSHSCGVLAMPGPIADRIDFNHFKTINEIPSSAAGLTADASGYSAPVALDLIRILRHINWYARYSGIMGNVLHLRHGIRSFMACAVRCGATLPTCSITNQKGAIP